MVEAKEIWMATITNAIEDDKSDETTNQVEALEQEYDDEKRSWETELSRAYWSEIQKAKPK
jgi:uncharacterized protein YukE